MALDEPKDSDEIVEQEGLKVVADKNLVAEMGGIDVSFRSAALGGSFIVRRKKESTGSCSC